MYKTTLFFLKTQKETYERAAYFPWEWKYKSGHLLLNYENLVIMELALKQLNKQLHNHVKKNIKCGFLTKYNHHQYGRFFIATPSNYPKWNDDVMKINYLGNLIE